MTRTYTPVTSYANAVATPAPRSIGATVAPGDSHGLKLSLEILSPYDAATAGAWDDSTSVWDTTPWSGYGAWVDYTDLVRGFAWVRGADSPGGPPRTGTATITLANREGNASPWATSGEFVEGSETWLRPGVYLRFGCTDSGSTYYPYFTGPIDSIDEGSSEGADSWVTLNVVESIAIYASITRDDIGGALGSGDDPDDRMTRIYNDVLARCGVAEAPGLDFSVPSYISPASGLRPTRLSGNVLDEMQLVAASVYGRIVPTSAGTVMLTGVVGGLVSPHLSEIVSGIRGASGQFSNQPALIAEYPIPIDGISTYASKERLLNDVRALDAGGSGAHDTDANSIARYGNISSGFGFPRTDLLCDLPTCVAIVANTLAARADDYLGIGSVLLDADMDDGLWWVLNTIANQGVEKRVALDIRWIHPGLNQFFQTCLLDGFTMSITPHGGQCKWTATIATSKE